MRGSRQARIGLSAAIQDLRRSAGGIALLGAEPDSEREIVSFIADQLATVVGNNVLLCCHG